MSAGDLERAAIATLLRCSHPDEATVDVGAAAGTPQADRWCVRCGAYRVGDGAWKRPYVAEDLAGFVSSADLARVGAR